MYRYRAYRNLKYESQGDVFTVAFCTYIQIKPETRVYEDALGNGTVTIKNQNINWECTHICRCVSARSKYIEIALVLHIMGFRLTRKISQLITQLIPCP